MSTNLDESVQRRELDLALRQSELNKRERELGQTIEAVETQRQRLEEVRTEYETRLEALDERSRELDAEWMRLREEAARLDVRSQELDAAAAPPAEQTPAPIILEYQTRLEALNERSRELDLEWTRLREEEARLEARSSELDAAAAASRAEPAPIGLSPHPEPEPVGVEPEPVAASAAAEVPSPRGPRSLIDDWWAKALGGTAPYVATCRHPYRCGARCLASRPAAASAASWRSSLMRSAVTRSGQRRRATSYPARKR